MKLKFLKPFRTTFGEVININYKLLEAYHIIGKEHPWKHLVDFGDMNVDYLWEEAKKDTSPHALQRMALDIFVKNSTDWVEKHGLRDFQKCMDFLFDEKQIEEDILRLKDLHSRGKGNTVYETEECELVSAYRSILTVAFSVMAILHVDRLIQDWKTGSMGIQRSVLTRMFMPAWQHYCDTVSSRYNEMPSTVLVDAMYLAKKEGDTEESNRLQLPSILLMDAANRGGKKQVWKARLLPDIPGIPVWRKTKKARLLLPDMKVWTKPEEVSIWFGHPEQYTGKYMTGIWLSASGLLNEDVRLLWTGEETLGGLRMLLDLHGQMTHDMNLGTVAYGNLYFAGWSNKKPYESGVFNLLEYAITRETFIQQWHAQQETALSFDLEANEIGSWLEDVCSNPLKQSQLRLLYELSEQTYKDGPPAFLKVPFFEREDLLDPHKIEDKISWLRANTPKTWVQNWMEPYKGVSPSEEDVKTDTLEELLLKSTWLLHSCFLRLSGQKISLETPVKGGFDILLRGYVGMANRNGANMEEGLKSIGLPLEDRLFNNISLPLQQFISASNRILGMDDDGHKKVLTYFAFNTLFIKNRDWVLEINLSEDGHMNSFVRGCGDVLAEALSEEWKTFLLSWGKTHRELFEKTVYPYFCEKFSMMVQPERDYEEAEKRIPAACLLYAATFEWLSGMIEEAGIEEDIEPDMLVRLLEISARDFYATRFLNEKGWENEYAQSASAFDIRKDFEEYFKKYHRQILAESENTMDEFSENIVF